VVINWGGLDDPRSYARRSIELVVPPFSDLDELGMCQAIKVARNRLLVLEVETIHFGRGDQFHHANRSRPMKRYDLGAWTCNSWLKNWCFAHTHVGSQWIFKLSCKTCQLIPQLDRFMMTPLFGMVIKGVQIYTSAFGSKSFRGFLESPKSRASKAPRSSGMVRYS